MRSCGDCQLCCKLVPVAEIGKPANARCQHQKFKVGCAIYSQRPHSCRKWTCAWLSEGSTADLRRPDRAHYVIDTLPDYVKLVDEDTGEVFEKPVMQIWAEEGYPDAHRDPALRAWLAKLYDETGLVSLVRAPGNTGAVALLPPAATPERKWREVVSNWNPEMEHTKADIQRVMKDHGLRMAD